MRPGGPGTDRYGRACRERRRRIEERFAKTAPCHDCDGRGYDVERHVDGSERAGTESMCTTCEGSGELPLEIVLFLAKRAA